MGPCPTYILVLVLCLAMTIHVENGLLPRPSIRAVRGPEFHRGQSVTIVCRSADGADTFRLEYKNTRPVLKDQTHVSGHGSQGTEGRFPIDSGSELTVRRYRCLYHKGSIWSQRSEPLELKVADEDVFPPPSGTTFEDTLPPTGAGSETTPTSRNYMVGNYVHIGLAGMVLLILVAILAEAGHSWHRWPHRPQEQRQGS